jgi:hypothetical protein
VTILLLVPEQRQQAAATASPDTIGLAAIYRGVSLPATLAAAAGTAILAQLALVLRWPLPLWLPWLLIAATGAGTVLSYALLSGMFPKSVLGHANSALNLVHVTSAFAIQ